MYPDPDPVRIQVNKINKFSKHLLVFKSQGMHLLPKTSAPTFFRFRLKKYNFLRKKEDFCWLNSAFLIILSVILYLWIHITGSWLYEFCIYLKLIVEISAICSQNCRTMTRSRIRVRSRAIRTLSSPSGSRRCPFP